RRRTPAASARRCRRRQAWRRCPAPPPRAAPPARPAHPAGTRWQASAPPAWRHRAAPRAPCAGCRRGSPRPRSNRTARSRTPPPPANGRAGGGRDAPAGAAGERGVPARVAAAAGYVLATARCILAPAGAPPLLEAARAAAIVARAVIAAILPAVPVLPAALSAV